MVLAQRTGSDAAAWGPRTVLTYTGTPDLLALHASEVKRTERRLDATGKLRCVDASACPTDARGLGIYKSGGFTAGTFSAYRAAWHQGVGKLWFAPAHPDTSVALIIQLTRLTSHRVTDTFREPHLAVARGTGELFYATNVRLRTTGDCMLVLRAGKDAACFLYRLN